MLGEDPLWWSPPSSSGPQGKTSRPSPPFHLSLNLVGNGRCDLWSSRWYHPSLLLLWLSEIIPVAQWFSWISSDKNKWNFNFILIIVSGMVQLLRNSRQRLGIEEETPLRLWRNEGKNLPHLLLNISMLRKVNHLRICTKCRVEDCPSRWTCHHPLMMGYTSQGRPPFEQKSLNLDVRLHPYDLRKSGQYRQRPWAEFLYKSLNLRRLESKRKKRLSCQIPL